MEKKYSSIIELLKNELSNDEETSTLELMNKLWNNWEQLAWNNWGQVLKYHLRDFYLNIFTARSIFDNATNILRIFILLDTFASQLLCVKWGQVLKYNIRYFSSTNFIARLTVDNAYNYSPYSCTGGYICQTPYHEQC